jgi:hypothetical protein
MSDEESNICPSCGAEAEFIITCSECGESYCPWCQVRHLDPNRVQVPGSIGSCPKCGNDKPEE